LGKTTKGRVTIIFEEKGLLKENNVCYDCALKLSDYINKGYIDYLVELKLLNKFYFIRLSKKQVCYKCSERRTDFVVVEYYFKNNLIKQVKKVCSKCFLKDYLEFKRLKGVVE